MNQAELIAHFSQRPSAFAWLIGAGTSRMSGLPTANDVIAYLKRRYYCQQESAEISLQDMTNEAVRARIQSFMDSKGFPPLWSPEEYSGYFDKIFGDDKERQRNFLRGILDESKVKLTVGNRVMGALLAAGHMRALFTTNFDSVVERAFAEVSGRSLAAYHLEGSHAALQALNNEEYPLYVKLHGDFRYDSIKNLTSDLLQQDQELARCLVASAARFGLIVAGYSGRDESVMVLLNEALDQTNAFPAGLFWTDIAGSRPLPAVTALIAKAKSKGIRTDLIEIETFDTLMLRLWRNIENKPIDLDAKVRRSATTGVDIPVPTPGNSRPLVRLNSLPIRQFPMQALRVDTSRGIDWSELRDVQAKARGKVIFTKGEHILAWGGTSDIKAAFGSLVTNLTPVDLPTDLFGSDYLYLQGFLEEALIKGLARGRPLLSRTTRNGSYLIVDRNAKDLTQLSAIKAKAEGLSGAIPGLTTTVTDEHPQSEPLYWTEALRVSLTWKNGQGWMLIDPDLWVWPPRGREIAKDFLDTRRRKRYNNRHDDLLSAWIETVFGKQAQPTVHTFTPFESGASSENPAFSIGSQTGYSWRLTA
ncbi:MAG: SIR2 family protein [Asticcacaulis sp.]|uniref:SIR2 family protein n=1 Tax=Asticcacaulis sp. TaxID=1872648 RepID=UPI0039E4DA0F